MTSSISQPSSTWPACLADPFRGIAFFDGVRIDSDRITDPRWDRVLPILLEEQVFMCRAMKMRGLLRPRLRVLDVGTGSGVFAIWAASHGCQVTALDICPRALRFTRHNLGHPSNASLIRSTGGSVDTLLADFGSWGGRSAEKFDLIVLAPPYNPTAPDILPARHAEAGPLGQSKFEEQLPLAWSLLAPKGTIVGNQMAFHARGRAEVWWRQQVARFAGRNDAKKCLVRFVPILKEIEYPAQSFLQAQYEHFLEAAFHQDPKPAAIRKYIDESLGDDPDDKVFGLYYYEISEAGDASGVTVDRTVIDLHPPADWADRIALHRRIVEHTSKQNSIPSPALFLDNDFTPPLPKRAENTGAAGAAGSPRDDFGSSPLSSLLKWIIQTRLVNTLSGTFDMLLVDVGPWFDAPSGRKAIRNEALLCTRSDAPEDPAELLNDYQLNTRSLQLLRLGPFLHPYFTGASNPTEWRGVQYHVIDRSEDGIAEHEDNESHRVAMWLGQLEDTFNDMRSRQNGPIDTASIIQASLTPGVKVAFATSSLDDLGVREVQEYAKRTEEEYNIEPYAQVPIEVLARDLELIHIMFHRRLRRILSSGSKARCQQAGGELTSALIGVPLSQAFSEPGSPGLPANYRGGLWIYAATQNRVGPREESMLFDLARLASILAGAAVGAVATASLAAAVRRAYDMTFGPEAEAWGNFKKSAGLRFNLSSLLHEAWRWLAELEKDTKVRLRGFDPMMDVLQSDCETFITRVLGARYPIGASVAVVLGRAASRGDRLAVPFVKALLGIEQIVTSPFSCVDCKNVSPGRLVRSLYVLKHKTPSDVLSVTFTVSEMVGSKIGISLMAVYRDAEAAGRAVSTLRLTPQERMERDSRSTPGEAVEACYWLGLEDPKWTMEANESEVGLKWSFHAVGIE